MAACRASIASLILACSATLGFGRTWTDSSGQFNIEGEFVASSGGVVTLKADSGKTIQIPLEKLSKADQDFIEKVNKPARKENPFVEVPKAAGNVAATDPVAKTQELVTDLLKRLDKEIDEIAALDTQEKRNAAHEKMTKAVFSELKQKSLTFRFTIQDIVAEDDGLSSTLNLTAPEGTEGFESEISRIELPIRKAEATKINSGDLLILSGNGVLYVSQGRGFQQFGGYRDFTRATIGSYGSTVSKHQYSVGLSTLQFKIEHRKPTDPPPPAPQPTAGHKKHTSGGFGGGGGGFGG